MAGSPHISATLEKPIRREGEYGGKRTIDGWLAVMDVWITVSPLSGRETLLARGAQSQITHDVECWWFPELKSDMRWRWQEADGEERILNIDTPIDIEN